MIARVAACYPLRMHWLVLLALAACGESSVTKAATSTADPEARSAYAVVSNVMLDTAPGDYRLWEIRVVADEPGTPCGSTDNVRALFDVYTIFSSAPRGTVPFQTDPPTVFPAAFAELAGAINVSGSISIPAASTTELVGSATGSATIDGVTQAFTIDFDAPTCVN